jgi:hypothetical protein
MDAAKKSQAEKIAVAALGGVFVIVFLTGPAKSLGLFGGSGASAPAPVEHVTISRPLGELIGHARQMTVDQLAEAQHPAGAAEERKRLFAAQELRDPFKSWIPDPVAEVEPAGLAGVDNGTEQDEEPWTPPEIVVQGLLWGAAKPKVIIDNEVYNVGEAIEGMQIVAVDRNGMTVEHGDSWWRYAPGGETPTAVTRSPKPEAQRR